MEPLIHINGILKSIDTSIQDRDKITVTHTRTVAAVFEKAHRNDLLNDNTFTVSVNQKKVTLKKKNIEFFIMGISVQPSHVIKDGDRITTKKPPFPTVDEVIAEIGKKAFDILTVLFNDEAVTIRKPRLALTLNGHDTEVSAVVKPGDRLDFVIIK